MRVGGKKKECPKEGKNEGKSAPKSKDPWKGLRWGLPYHNAETTKTLSESPQNKSNDKN